jgi:RNA polymerase sigma-70 factor, ECF subfamily
MLSRITVESAENEAPDAELVAAARRDPAAFLPLYRRYVSRIYRYLLSRTGNQHDAEDLTSQTFAEAMAGLDRYREQGQFAAWLFSIARRRLADHHRRQRVDLPLSHAITKPAPDPPPSAAVIQNEELAYLATLLERLDEDRQELLRLRFAAGLTYGEIGRLINRSEAATKMAVHRLLRQLEEEWNHDTA